MRYYGILNRTTRVLLEDFMDRDSNHGFNYWTSFLIIGLHRISGPCEASTQFRFGSSEQVRNNETFSYKTQVQEV